MSVFFRALCRYALIFLFQIFRWIPLRISSAMAAGLMAFFSLFLRNQRRIAMENLQKAYPLETSSRHFKQIIAGGFRHLGLTIAEMLHFVHDPDDMTSRVSIEGIEYLEAALSRDKGVVIVTAHVGNFPLMIAHVAMKGYKTKVILKPPRDHKLNAYFAHRWEKISGAKVIYSMPRLACIHQALKVLRENGLLFILPDQNFGDDGRVFVRFFGRLAATGTGPLVFARRAGSPLLPMFIIRQADGTHKIVIEKPMDPRELSTEQETELVNTQVFTNVIENIIRRHPEQWLWFHKRWKTQPVSTDVVIDR